MLFASQVTLPDVSGDHTEASIANTSDTQMMSEQASKADLTYAKAVIGILSLRPHSTIFQPENAPGSSELWPCTTRNHILSGSHATQACRPARHSAEHPRQCTSMQPRVQSVSDSSAP